MESKLPKFLKYITNVTGTWKLLNTSCYLRVKVLYPLNRD